MQTGQEHVMIKTYELLVQELAPFEWASPTRYQFALGCRRSIGDVAKAKSLLYEILDADNCIDPATDTISDSIPYLTRRELAEIIYEEFLQATSSSQKARFTCRNRRSRGTETGKRPSHVRPRVQLSKET
ncbi:hypothetical protein NW764_015856 [Fusarium oxysporum]|nr:hypothetical protein NW764_015856 [Fusarium oxysporum]